MGRFFPTLAGGGVQLLACCWAYGRGFARSFPPLRYHETSCGFSVVAVTVVIYSKRCPSNIKQELNSS